MKEARAGLIERLLEDQELVQLLAELPDGGGPSITVGWPWEMLERAREEAAAEELPMITVLPVTDVPRRPGIGRLILQVDMWVWPVGENGGLGRLDRIDELVYGRLDEAGWIHNGVRLYALSSPSNEFPAGPGEPLRRERTFEVRYSRI